MKRKLFWVGDATVSSGFAKCTHSVLDELHSTGLYDITLIGMYYQGEKHNYPYDILPTHNDWLKCNDMFGVRRTLLECNRRHPDVIVILNDPWNIPPYLKSNVPTIGWLAVDAKNIQGAEMNGLAAGVFWTEFGRREACEGGFVGDTHVVQLGVDTQMYYPLKDKAACRKHLKLPEDAFIVGCVGRNQYRKRLDLAMLYFAEWIQTKNIKDAYLFLHVAPTGEKAWDLKQLAKYLGISSKVLISTPEIGYGSPEPALRVMYNALDLMWNTGTEGWWLPGMEAMACGVPCLAGDWSALGTNGGWTEDAMYLVPCTTVSVTAVNSLNTIAGIPDRRVSVDTLDKFYRSPALRQEYGRRGYDLVTQPQFRWSHIAGEFHKVIETTLDRRARYDPFIVDIPVDVGVEQASE